MVEVREPEYGESHIDIFKKVHKFNAKNVLF